MNRDRLKTQLRMDEGVIPHAYTDSEGYLTIGCGSLIDRVKGGRLSSDEIEFLLNNDIDRVAYRLSHDFKWYDDLSDVRQEVLINMAFTLGMDGLKTFKLMLAAIERQDWVDAAREGLDSMEWTGGGQGNTADAGPHERVSGVKRAKV